MPKLELTYAGEKYDRTQALFDGIVCPEGISLNCMPVSTVEIFFRMLRFGEFDASEMSMSNYLTDLCSEHPRFVAIPVFVSRMFRHSSLYINTNSGIKTAEDLKGKSIGVPEYHVTTALWVRGILQHEYGVSPKDLTWFTGGIEEPGRKDRMNLKPPEGVSVVPIPKDATLNDMLANGSIDALLSPQIPSCVKRGSKSVARLWPDSRAVEEDYYRRTGIFPIMHTVVLKREIFERHPWTALSLYKAFCEAKKLCLDRLNSVDSRLLYSLPWLVDDLAAARNLMGDDLWPYGVEVNVTTLEPMLDYAYEQGMTSRRLGLEELFAPSTYELSKL
jgi:4,5-dihydroxyphthalate decarboxylase